MAQPVPVTSGLKNPILRAISKPIEKVTPEIKKLIQVMKVTMEKEEGIGIAAPQVDVNLRLALVKLNPNSREEKIITMINPEILQKSLRTETGDEGCLSLRGKWGAVERAFSLTVKFLDPKWQEHVLKLDALNARIVQHEVDHLEGILFWDRVKEEDKAKGA